MNSLKDYFAKANIIGGIVYWKSNGSVPPADIVRDMAMVDTDITKEEYIDIAACDRVRAEQVRKAIEGYKASRVNRTAEQRAEEAYEMRAAFGSGVEVVNICTGERVTS